MESFHLKLNRLITIYIISIKNKNIRPFDRNIFLFDSSSRLF